MLFKSLFPISPIVVIIISSITNFSFLILVLFLFKSLAAVYRYCDADKKSNHIPGKEQFHLLVMSILVPKQGISWPVDYP
jgi:archaellum biogenesis protein FlaJ (TadC family)